MATLENIRKRGKLLAIVIGFALLAFILGGLLKKSGRPQSQDIAEINGDAISLQDYQAQISAHTSFYKFALRTQNLNEKQNKAIRKEVWDMMVRDKIMKPIYDECGISVSDKEVSELVFGSNGKYAPIITQLPIFKNQQTGSFDPQIVSSFFSNLNRKNGTEQIALHIENIIRQERLYEKYFSLLSKSMYITDNEAKMLYTERVSVVDFDFAMLKYSTIPDSTVTVSKEDLEKYYNKHKEEYKQEASRDIKYIAFKIEPSKQDINDAENNIKSIKKDFMAISKDSIDEIADFIDANCDVPFKNLHTKKGKFGRADIDSTIFNAPLDTTYGPYIENGHFKIVRLLEKTKLPDTVEVSHILIQPDGQVIKDLDRAYVIADSLQKAIKKGEDFAKVAKNHSADKRTSEKGGDIDKFTEEVGYAQAFKDSCFYANTGDIKLVKMPYGIHIIKVKYQSPKIEKVKVAVLDKFIEAGQNTRNLKYSEAIKFASANKTLTQFEENADKEKLTKIVVNRLTPNTEVIAGVKTPNSIITWTFKEETEKGSVSEIFRDGDKFIYAVVTEVREKGIAPFNQVKEYITPIVKKEKKGEMLAKKLKGAGSDIASIASKTKAIKATAKNVSFSSTRIPNGGNEPLVVATALKIGKEKLSDPVIGNSGVYVLKVTSKTGVSKIDEKMVENDKKMSLNRMMSRAYNPRSRTTEPFEAVKENAGIKDDRYRFF